MFGELIRISDPYYNMKRYLPSLNWLSGYNLKTLSYDSIAGITLAAYAIPVSIAYASLAGLAPQYGIFGYLLGGLFYAFLGTGKQLAIGPTSAISMLVGITLADLSGGDPQRWLDLASLTAMVFSGICVVAFLLRLDSMINFISETVLVGFKAGAALTIMLSQLPKAFGVPGGGHSFFDKVTVLIPQIPDTNLYVLIFGLVAFGLMLAGEKFFHGKPIAIFVVILSIFAVSFTPLGKLGFKTVGIIPSGLPVFHFPDLNWADIQSVGYLAFACFLLAYVESVSAAKALAYKNGYEINPHQELLALGLANLATSVGGGYPVSGGLSQSAVNDEAGAKTPMSLVFASVFIGICLIFLTGLLKNLPAVILAAIVFIAVERLVNIKEFVRMWKHNKFDFVIATLALISVICFGILQGVLIGALASLILIIRMVSSPNIAFLGRIPGTDRFTDIKRHPDNEVLPGVLLFRVEAPLVYFNTSYVYNHVWPRLSKTDPKLKAVIFDLSTSAYVDSSGARLIKRLFLDLKEMGIEFKVAEAHSEVRDILRFEDVEHLLGHVGRRDSIHEVLTHTLTVSEITAKLVEEETKKK
jgi:SulP family sulfate permease